jgi:hypothetical protein
MTQEEQDEREFNFISMRLTLLLSEAAGYAAYFKIPIDAFVNGAMDAYLAAEELLEHKTEEVTSPNPEGTIVQE